MSCTIETLFGLENQLCCSLIVLGKSWQLFNGQINFKWKTKFNINL